MNADDSERAAVAEGDPFRAKDIDIDFVPQARDTVSYVELDGEAILLDEETGIVHHLNPTGTIVWKCLDGSGTVAKLSVDLADAFGAPLDVISNDVIELVRLLGARGLLVGVEPDPPEQHSHAQPSGLEPGTTFPPFALPDLNGRITSLEEHRGGRVLLVNWSAHCGFCDRVAPELAAAEPDLVKNNVHLLFLAYGSADENRAKLDQWGFEAPVLLQDGRLVDPFVGLGTPVAYLLDEEAAVVEPLAVGANQVPELVRKALDLSGCD